MGIRIKLLKSYIKKIVDNVPIISNISFMVMVYLVEKYSNFTWVKNTSILILFFLWIMFIQAFDRYRKNELYKPEFPNIKKRFTKKIDDGIVIKKSDWEEAIIYLCEIEDYLGK